MDRDRFDRFAEITSSHIAEIAVDGGSLFVQFANGAVYEYPDSANYFDEIVSAKSAGKFFREHVRNRTYKKVTVW